MPKKKGTPFEYLCSAFITGNIKCSSWYLVLLVSAGFKPPSAVEMVLLHLGHAIILVNEMSCYLG